MPVNSQCSENFADKRQQVCFDFFFLTAPPVYLPQIVSTLHNQSQTKCHASAAQRGDMAV